MKIEKVDIKKIHANAENPRSIKSHKFSRLVKSIKDFPEMLKVRPIVVNDDNVILGGNMRYRACREAGLEDVYIIKASELTPEQQNQFIIKDNVEFGEWDIDMLANQYEKDFLVRMGLEEKQLGFFQDDFEKEFNTIDTQSVDMPINPKFSEKYTSVMIFCDNELDETWLRNVLKLKKAKSYKTERIKETSVISVQDFQELWQKK